MRFGLGTNVIDKILEVFQDFPSLEEAVIYGSRAMGTYKEGSDIDLTLKGALSYEDMLRIQVELEDKMLPYTFDLSLHSSLRNEELLDHIERVGKTLFKREEVELKQDQIAYQFQKSKKRL